MENLQEAIKIDGFDADTQHAFDKLAAYFAVFKSRANPSSPRYITKLNQFQLKFMEFLDKATSEKGKLQVRAYISEIQRMVAANDNAPADATPTVIAGGKVVDLDKRRKGAKRNSEYEYVNPNNGGEYWDGDVHVYEAPSEEEALDTLRKAGFKASK